MFAQPHAANHSLFTAPVSGPAKRGHPVSQGTARSVAPQRRGESLADMARGIAALLPGEALDELAGRVKAATGYEGIIVVIC
jgi:hypothetical protein